MSNKSIDRKQVIQRYREISVELKALGILNHVNNLYFYNCIAQELECSHETIRKIIESYKKTAEHKVYFKFIKTIPCIYNKVRKEIISCMINKKLSDG